MIMFGKVSSQMLLLFFSYFFNCWNLNRKDLVLVFMQVLCHNPTLREGEDETHTPEMGTGESSGTHEISEFDCKGQNTSHRGFLYIIGKLSKCKCPKWARMTHLDICNTSYGQKKGRESNCQFDSRPREVRNRSDSLTGRWRATCRWKAFDEGYNFGLDLISIGGLHQKF